MRILLNTTRMEDIAITAPSIKVCMHVLAQARADARVIREATTLTAAGFEVSIVDIEPKDRQLVEENIDGIYLKHMLMSNTFILRRFDQQTLLKAVLVFIRSMLRLIQDPADIYHAHDVSALPACYIAARVRRKPLIFDSHELPLLDRLLSEMSRSRRWLIKLLEVLLERMLPDCAGIIMTSPFHAQQFRNHYHVPEVTLVRNVPPFQVVPHSDRLRQQLGLSPDVRIALYQGNLQRNRELDRLVLAARFLEPNIVIVMMGKDNRGTRAQLEALIASEGVADRVKILPAIPYEELLVWTASADLGLNILPPDYSLSLRLCLGNKLFEYLMAGLPILTSQLDAAVELIKTYDVGQVVASLAPADVAAAVNAVLADRVALERMHRNALAVAKQELCWEKEKKQLLRLYQELCDKYLPKL